MRDLADTLLLVKSTGHMVEVESSEWRTFTAMW
jgi:hypothetical protein